MTGPVTGSVAGDVFPVWQPVRVPVKGGGTFPVRNVYGVTRNYAAAGTTSANEDRIPPAIITKSPHWVSIASAGVAGAGAAGATIPYPPATRRLEPEVEMVIAIGRNVISGGDGNARDAIFGYAVGLDMTRRDLQHAAREKRDPLDIAKWFEGATPLSEIARAAEIGHPAEGAITLDANGARAQAGDLSHMIWKPAEIVALLARHFPLHPGDIVFTGTPPGEIVLARGDTLHARIAGVGALRVTIGS